ncbi:universal stress protein [Kitasatospora griseola]|uniref:universal stress protein n=1 Tax=Kitasatospora griseola TaxID=2064 RepID=UPI0037FEC1DD
MSDSVVAGVDGSAESTAAAHWAAAEAHRRRVPLRLVHVVPPEDGDLPHREPAGSRRPDSAAALRAEIAHALPHLDVSCDLVPGHPWSALTAAGETAGLLVLGSSGPGGVTGRLLGSVALRAAAEARCPVVLVPADAGPATATGEVVVGLRGDRPSDAVLAFAFEEAARRGAVLRALEGRTEPDGPLHTDGPVTPEQLRWSLVESRTVRLQDALAHWRGKFPEVRTAAEVSGRSASRTLLDASRGAALVVLGRRAPAHPLAAPKLGHVVHAVIHRAHGPVAVVPYD